MHNEYKTQKECKERCKNESNKEEIKYKNKTKHYKID
jgi:hypothetical protein